MSVPYNAPSRLKRRRQVALDNLEKQIASLSKSDQGSDSLKLQRAQECAKNLWANLDSSRGKRKQ